MRSVVIAIAIAASAAEAQEPDAVARAVGDSVQAMADRGEFSGTVLITHNGRTILELSKGFADQGAEYRNTSSTRFNLASGDKLFTKVAIGQLLLEGRLSLSDTVGKFLPDYPNRTVRHKVTVQQLLRHTSGLGSFWNERFAAERPHLDELRDFQQLFENEEPAFEPGERMRYSNNGYILLGRIVEVVSGESYYDYVENRVFRPAAMTSTGYLTTDEWPADKARGYTRQESGSVERPPAPQQNPGSLATSLRDNGWSLSYRGSSAGGGYSTVRDLASLDSAIRNGVYGDIATFAAMFARSPDRRQIIANGGGPGANMEFSRLGDYTIIVLSNYDPPAASRILQSAVALILNGSR